ncbi:hypothetical protein QBC39DRAFT_160599 [Podospora conica]|nr:hypothetical protein QBC39DRAFT_160599 [Schizothecium conicum]
MATRWQAGYTFPWACCYSGLCPNLASGVIPSGPQLPSSHRLTASDPFAIDGHGNSCWTAQRHGDAQTLFRIQRSSALAWASGPRHRMRKSLNAIGPWAQTKPRRKPCGPSCITYILVVCVRPQEMLCSSQTRSRKPTDGGGTRFPLSMRFPPPRKPNPVRSGALGGAEGEVRASPSWWEGVGFSCKTCHEPAETGETNGFRNDTQHNANRKKLSSPSVPRLTKPGGRSREMHRSSPCPQLRYPCGSHGQL